MSLEAATYQYARTRGGGAELSARAKFRLTGGDRVRYLHGQVTANIARLQAGQTTPGCVTTAKGKLCGEVWVRAEPEALLVDAEPELREALLARLERYIVADDVVLEDVTDEYALRHFLPPHAAGPQGTVNRFGLPGTDAWLPVAEATPLEEPLSPEYLETLRIEAGLPRWGRELGEETLPPEAGLDRTHVDYHKGCYIGQETISRLRSVGQVNRLLRGWRTPGGEPLRAGWPLFAPGSMEKPVGALTSATWSFALATPIALGYARRGSPETLLAVPPQGEGSPLEVLACELPFVSLS